MQQKKKNLEAEVFAWQAKSPEFNVQYPKKTTER